MVHNRSEKTQNSLFGYLGLKAMKQPDSSKVPEVFKQPYFTRKSHYEANIHAVSNYIPHNIINHVRKLSESRLHLVTRIIDTLFFGSYKTRIRFCFGTNPSAGKCFQRAYLDLLQRWMESDRRSKSSGCVADFHVNGSI